MPSWLQPLIKQEWPKIQQAAMYVLTVALTYLAQYLGIAP